MTLLGTAANDTFVGGVASNTVIGGGGTDTLDYSGLPAGVSVSAVFSALGTATITKTGPGGILGVDSVTGIADIIGTAAADVFDVTGAYGASSIGTQVLVLTPGAGNDTILAGGRTSVEVSYATAITGVNVDLLAGTAQDGQGGTDTLGNVVRVLGSAFNDTMSGGDRSDIFVASLGSDSYDGGGGTNTIDYTGLGTAPVAITMTGDSSGFAVKSGGGTDSLVNISIVQGSSGGDSITGFASAARMTLLRGMAGNDTIDGAGNALNVIDYAGSPAGVSVNLATGVAHDGFGSTDTLRNVRAISGSDFADSITGGTASEIFYGTLGNDTYAGGGGLDTLNYARLASGPVTVRFSDGVNGTATKGAGGAYGTDSFTGMASIVGTGAADDLGGHTVANGTLLWLDGRNGNDTLRGYGIADNIADYASRTGPLIATLGAAGTASLAGGEVDTLVNIVAIRGTSGDDTITGSTADEHFYGSRGNDLYVSGGGTDTIDYSQGGVPAPITLTWSGTTAFVAKGGTTDVDQLSGVADVIGTAQNDVFSGATTLALSLTGGGGVDTLTYAAAATPVDIVFADTGRSGTVGKAGAGGTTAIDRFVDMAIAIGSAGADTITGSLGTPSSASDTIELRGEAGNDVIDGRDSTRNIVSYADSPGPVTISLQVSVTADGHVMGTASDGFGGTDTLIDVVRVLGSAYADSITGSSGDDIIDGGGGNDTIDGGPGHDTVILNRPASSTTLTHNADGSWTATGPLGTDHLINVEAVQFGTGTIILQTAASDFTGNGFADLLFDQTIAGAGGTDYRILSQWHFGASGFTAGDTFASVTADWSIVGRGDLNGDGRTDLIWQNTDGSVSAWLMNGFTFLSGETIYAPGGATPWHVLGVGDFNYDGRADLLFGQHQTYAGHDYLALSLWTMNGLTPIATTSLGAIDGSWGVNAVADFNGDGRADILWRNADGAMSVWYMNGGSYLGGGTFSYAPADWNVVGTGDFNGDGKADIVWQRANGDVSVWLMGNDGNPADGPTVISSATIASPGPSWHVAAVGDFNGDGKADILFRSDPIGTSSWTEAQIWTMDGLTVKSASLLSYIDNSWHLIA